MPNKKYAVIFTKEILVKARDKDEAMDIAIEKCADDVEMLMPHNMAQEVNESTLSDDYFD